MTTHMDNSQALVTFSGVQKTYDGTHLVVRDLNLVIQRGEFLSLLGPAGPGKTTTVPSRPVPNHIAPPDVHRHT